MNPTPASAILDGPASFVKNVFAILGEIYLSLNYGGNKLEYQLYFVILAVMNTVSAKMAPVSA